MWRVVAKLQKKFRFNETTNETFLYTLQFYKLQSMYTR